MYGDHLLQAKIVIPSNVSISELCNYCNLNNFNLYVDFNSYNILVFFYF